ncbi:unnamed protein product [Allacma fusca]|uniref:Uncharacterized protein n=1 Tax=Allacma fusca TaxID=39272 RepID=A0A8J2LNR5_9HEXA|nr:unnamed protein product [Allacma fusca]
MASFCRQFWVLIFLILPSVITSMPATSKSVTEKSEKTSSVFALDIESCTCKAASRDCEVAISSSIFSEIKCPENQHFCCSVAKKHAKDDEALKANDSTRAEVKVKIVSTEDAVKLDPLVPAYNMTTKTETRCKCKLREKCSEKNTDYSFGFHCSYDKVRCCEPVDSADSGEGDNSGVGGRVINVFTNPANEKLSKSCRCLPESQCNISPDQVLKRKDTACPDNLIQCCGEAIAEKKSDEDASALVGPEISTRLFTPSASSAAITKANESENGHSALHQPVPIPLVKIPSIREPQVDLMSMTTTIPPPNLPNQYFFTPAISQSYHKYYSAPQKPLLPSQYLNPSRPFVYRVGNRYAINQNGRGLAESERSSGSFLSNLASMLG